MLDLIPCLENLSAYMVDRQMQAVLACPECGARRQSLTILTENKTYKPRYVVVCQECKYLGPFGITLSAAIDRWNKPLGALAYWLKQRQRKRGQGQPQWRILPVQNKWIGQ